MSSERERAAVTAPSSSSGHRASRLDTGVPHSARVWDYWLGGKDNFAADRAVADKIQAAVPDIVASARADRAFLGRAVRHLVGEQGVRQFLDIGTGIPAADNTHQVAQQMAADSRIVYADNDPLVLTHARALLTSHSHGATAYIDADLREPDKILDAAAHTLNFDQPIAVMLLGILNFIPDDDQAGAIVDRLIAAVPSGSSLVISHPTTGINKDVTIRAAQLWNQSSPTEIAFRSRQQLLRFFHGLDLLEPGVVTCPQWRPDPQEHTGPPQVMHYGGVARKP